MDEDGEKQDPEAMEGPLSGARLGLFREITAWIATSGKWWLVPVLLGLLLVGVLVTLGGSVLAPFIYPLF